MTSLHAHMARSVAFGWACKIIDCDTASPPKACVLLILSVVMMIVTILVAASVGL